MTTSAIEVHEIIEKNAKAASQEKRVIETIKVGQAIRQGDIYMVRLDDKGVTEIKMNDGSLVVNVDEIRKKGVKADTRQLAPGESKGSRHIIGEGPTIYKSNAVVPTRFGGQASVDLIGPVVVAGDRFELTHPEHAHFSLPAGVYQVFYQGDWQGVMRRALD